MRQLRWLLLMETMDFPPEQGVRFRFRLVELDEPDACEVVFVSTVDDLFDVLLARWGRTQTAADSL